MGDSILSKTIFDPKFHYDLCSGHCEVNRGSRWSQKCLISLFLQFYSLLNNCLRVLIREVLFESTDQNIFFDTTFMSSYDLAFQIYWPDDVKFGPIFVENQTRKVVFGPLIPQNMFKMFFLWYGINLLDETSLLVPHSSL